MKTTTKIYNDIIAEKQSGNYTELDELNSTSKVAVWRLWVWIFAFFSKVIYEVQDSFKSYVEIFFAKNQVGTLSWWIDTVGKFQYGDILQFIDKKYQYSVLDTDKQIVSRVALSVQESVLEFKVAKFEDDKLVSLTVPELEACESYINRIKPVGTYISINTYSADNLKLGLRIYYNAQYSQSLIETQINDKISGYLSEIIFNGSLSETELTDELQQIEGVVNPVFISGEAKASFEPTYNLFEDYYQAVSGYFELTELNLEFIAK